MQGTVKHLNISTGELPAHTCICTHVHVCTTYKLVMLHMYMYMYVTRQIVVRATYMYIGVIMYLPDRVGVLASISSAPEDRLSALLPEVVDTHSPIIQPHCQEVGVGGVDVQREYTSGGGVDESRGREGGEE